MQPESPPERKSSMETLKYGVFGLWFGALAAIFFGDESVKQIGHLTFWGTAAAHLAEFFWKRSFFEQVGGEMSGHFTQTMIYGLFYWKPLEDARKGR